MTFFPTINGQVTKCSVVRVVQRYFDRTQSAQLIITQQPNDSTEKNGELNDE